MWAVIPLALLAAIAFFLQGYDQAVFNGVVSLSSFVAQFPRIDTLNTHGAQQRDNARIQGTVVAVYEVGCALGALSCYFLGDRLGRKRTMLLMGLIVVVGATLQSSSFSLGQLIFSRVFTGLGVGGYTATVPMWISECAPARTRGVLVLICGGFAITGIAFANWLEFGLYFVRNNQVSWRLPIALQGLYAIIVSVTVPWLPESPRWLVKQTRQNEALVILNQLRGDKEIALQELTEIEGELMHTELSESPFSVGETNALLRTCLAIGINILAQMSGINTITFYSTSVLQEQLHFDAMLSRLYSACLQTWQALCAWAAVFLVSLFSRRSLMIFSAIGMCATLACLTGLMSQADNCHSCAKASLAFEFLGVTFFPIGLFLIPMMYAAEISGPAVRHKVTAMSSCANWLFNFLVAEVTPIAFHSIRWRYYIVYTAINVFTAAAVFLIYPETQGRSLEEINCLFRNCEDLLGESKLTDEGSALGVLSKQVQLAEMAAPEPYGGASA